MQKGSRYLFTASLTGILLLAAVLCACSTNPSTQYKQVTFAELTGNTTAYDGQNVSITGIYLGRFTGLGCTTEFCTCNCSEVKIIESYKPLNYLLFWGIDENGTTIAFVPPSDKDNTPSLEIGKEITIKGVVEARLWSSPCPCPCSCERYRTLLIYADELSTR